MEFKELRDRLSKNFDEKVKNRELFMTDIDKDELWELYLESFPEGTNPVFRKRREFDCSCCRGFIKNIGGAVYIDDDMNIHSIFEFDTGSEMYQPVMDAMAAYVTAHKIVAPYASADEYVGQACTRELDEEGKVTSWSHYQVKLPNHLIFKYPRKTLGTAISQFKDTRNVFKRSLDEISVEAIETVLELIASNTLYRGQEWKGTLTELLKHKQAYEALTPEKKDNYCWAMARKIGAVLGRIRNHSIGVLLTSISCGMDLDDAVRRYELIVAPANYKRPKAIFTKKMLEAAQNTVQELGYMDSLPRKFATLDDITVNNILFSDRDAAKRILGSGNVFDEMKRDADVINPRQFTRVESIGIERFISDVLPRARSVDAFLETRHAPNMVSLIAPVNPESNTMFKWNNRFSWAYSGNMTDSNIRENVKSAGGNVDGVLRFSIQWNDIEDDFNDLDAHCVEPSARHIWYGQKLSPNTRGNLDVDIITPKIGVPAVENITWPNRQRMPVGDYRFYVKCFHSRGGKSGFRAEIEYDGQVFQYNYNRTMHTDEIVDVAVVTLNEDGTFTISEKLPSSMSQRDVWGVKTNQFTPVSVIMYSPNYWDEQDGIGSRHYMFMLKGCVNPEKPNGFYNEFLKHELDVHKRVFEALGSKMAVADTDDQLSGVGFAETKRNDMIVRVRGASEQIMRVVI